jgi:hypothetical protein
VSAIYSRREALAVIAAGAAMFVRPALSADFAWQRFKGTKVRFMVSTHPWTAWAHEQLAGLEAATGITVDWEILYEDQFRQKLPLTLRADPGAVDGFFTLPSWDGAAFARAPPDMIDAIKQGIPNAVPNGANPLIVPVPEVRAAIGSAIVAVLQGGNAEKVGNDAQRQVLQILKG